jgi:hypothetical protein
MIHLIPFILQELRGHRGSSEPRFGDWLAGSTPKAWQCKAAHEKQNWINTPNSIIIRGLLSIIMCNESPAPFTQNAKFAVSNCRMSHVSLLTPTRFLPSSSPWKQKEHIVPQLRSSLSLLRQRQKRHAEWL